MSILSYHGQHNTGMGVEISQKNFVVRVLMMGGELLGKDRPTSRDPGAGFFGSGFSRWQPQHGISA